MPQGFSAESLGYVRQIRTPGVHPVHPSLHVNVTLVIRNDADLPPMGVLTGRIEFGDPKGSATWRLRQQIGLICQSMPTGHAALRHGADLEGEAWDPVEKQITHRKPGRTRSRFTR
jgi:hypothetical protein